jgi:hypothetical protein
VIPDAGNISGIVGALKESAKNNPDVTLLYQHLDRMKSLDPIEHQFDNAAFEKFGFHVVGASLYLGTQLLSSSPPEVTDDKRLGLAKWVHDELPGFSPTNVRVLCINMDRKGEYFPYNSAQNKLEDFVSAILTGDDESNAVFIHTGEKANCDYLYFFRL